MSDRDDDGPAGNDILADADRIEEITCRLEAGDPVTAGDLGDDPDPAGTIRQLLPTLRAMVSLGEQVTRDEGLRTRSRKIRKSALSLLDATPDVEETGS